MTTTIQLKKTFVTHEIDWPEEITASVSSETQNRINSLQKFIVESPDVCSISIGLVDGLLSETTISAIDDVCRFDIARIIVYREDWIVFLQSKWDSAVQAEYSLAA